MDLTELMVDLVKDGLKHDLRSFHMRARRVAEASKAENPELAKAIIRTLKTTPIRRQPTEWQPAASQAPIDQDSRQSLVREEESVAANKPQWDHLIAKTITEFVFERRNEQKLVSHGLLPARSLLLEGPPGVGKTMTARWLASELTLPLITLDLTTVINSLLGKTGNNIKSVLDYARSKRCVLLLDEFDSIAKRRSDDSDVGELKRLVTVLLQTIDDWPHSSILVAATNHGELLDPAIWRRFDHVLHFSPPSESDVIRFLTARDVDPKIANDIASTYADKSYSSLERILHRAKKSSLLYGIDHAESIRQAFGLKTQSTSSREFRDSEILKMHAEGLNKTQISCQLGISRPTVRRVIRRWQIGDNNA
ncbi:AAA family ATPase [Marinobacter sp.]|uniref:AAA family ATPase n=1 Tax=Marinobacter sp. TaxID=50741 RepID=UPI003A8D36BC